MNNETIIRMENVSVDYDGKEVIRNVSLTLAAHGFLGIVGPNGGGKTSLLRVMLGLKRPSQGTVTYFRNGQSVKKIRMGYLPQVNAFDLQFPITVRDVIATGMLAEKGLTGRIKASDKEKLEKMIAWLGLEELAKRQIGQLSGGQRQRVLIGRALMSRPEVVVLDEPGTYVDRENRAKLYELLDEINDQCAIVMVSHDTETLLEHAEKVVRIDRKLELLTPSNESPTDHTPQKTK